MTSWHQGSPLHHLKTPNMAVGTASEEAEAVRQFVSTAGRRRAGQHSLSQGDSIGHFSRALVPTFVDKCLKHSLVFALCLIFALCFEDECACLP